MKTCRPYRSSVDRSAESASDPLHNLQREFFCIQAGLSFSSQADAELWFRSRPRIRIELGHFPKLNRMTHRLHSVKVEAQIVNSVKDLRQHFIRRIEMAQVGAGIAAAYLAIAVGIERRLIGRVAGLLDGNFALGSE